MYAICDIPIAPTTVINRYYSNHTVKISSSNKKAWNDVFITVTKEYMPDISGNKNISHDFINAQELAIKKLWESPENDIWDNLYQELNA